MIFPIGAPNDAYAQYFSGQSYLAPISSSQVSIANACDLMQKFILQIARYTEHLLPYIFFLKKNALLKK